MRFECTPQLYIWNDVPAATRKEIVNERGAALSRTSFFVFLDAPVCRVDGFLDEKFRKSTEASVDICFGGCRRSKWILAERWCA